MGCCGQICVLLWKNWLIQRRRIWASIFEAGLPIFFAALIVLLRMVVEVEEFPEPTYYEREKIFQESYWSYGESGTLVGYAPITAETDELMQYMGQLMENRTVWYNVTTMGFKTEKEAVDYYSENSKRMRNIFIFEDIRASDALLPKKLSYTIRPRSEDSYERWFTDKTDEAFTGFGPRYMYPNYKDRGIISLQVCMAEAVAMYWKAQRGQHESIHFEVYDQRMAYPPYYQDFMVLVLQSLLPLMLVLSFNISVVINTKNLVYEKEHKLKEAMKVMGLHTSVYWISWLVTFAMYTVPVMAMYALLLGLDLVEGGPVLAQTDITVFFVFLLCYGAAMITFCFMISAFVQKANVASTVAGILFFVFYTPFFYLTSRYDSSSRGTKLMYGLSFNTAMGLGAQILSRYESTGNGAQWSNFSQPPVVDDNSSLLDCMVILLIDSVIHILIAWYVDKLRPGEYGMPQPWYFPCTKTYWFGSHSSPDASSGVHQPSSKNFEKDPTDLDTGIQISNLRKEFGKKVAVAGTSLTMYKGQITVLLGHNGAGKTTTMSMLTGFTPPTSGTAQVNGFDVRKDIDRVRSSLGYCPQHNILFDTLTVKEHLTFFAKLKGHTSSELDEEVRAVAKEVGLEAKLNDKSQTLSGGQKRKLSVGIALIGGSEVVILDEPTSGMDPGARRQTWTVLQTACKDRTLVLSTHYMDEADILGDRIAIMAEGVVKCCGSSMFLKKLYGAGYHLVIVRLPDCDLDKLTQVVQSHIPTAEMETAGNTEVTYLLPDNESAKFPALFNELEDKLDNIGITSFGISATTMEEVFLKVGQSAYDEEDRPKLEGEGFSNSRVGISNGEENAASPGETTTSINIDGKDKSASATNLTVNNDIIGFNKGFTKNTGLSLIGSRMKGIFVKKALFSWRSRMLTIATLLLPVCCAVLVMIQQVDSNIEEKTEPLLKFDLSPFMGSHTPYTAGLSATSDGLEFAKLYASQFESSNMEKFEMPEYQSFDNYTTERAEELGTWTYKKKMPIGMEVINQKSHGAIAAVSHYNGDPYHAEPIAMNYLMNTFLQWVLNSSSYGLQSSLEPLPRDAKENVERMNYNIDVFGLYISLYIGIGMAFPTSLFMYFLISERASGAKHLQVVSGVGPITYWLPTYLWDFINYSIAALLLIILFVSFDMTAYVGDGRLALVTLVLLNHGWSVLPFIYVFQFAFNKPSTGVSVVVALNFITGLVTTITVFSLSVPSLEKEAEAHILDIVFKTLFPNYNLVQSLSDIYVNYERSKKCKNVPCFFSIPNPCCKDTCKELEYCTPYEESYVAWSRPGIGSYLVFMNIQWVVFAAILLMTEYHVFNRLWYVISGLKKKEDFNEEARMSVEDSDVAEERRRIRSCAISLQGKGKRGPRAGDQVELEESQGMLPADATDPADKGDSLLLWNLYKRYSDFVAVDHVSVGVPEQECFGLLGPNGAGKTTTFKMLTGDVMVTDGNAYLKGYDVRNNIKKVQANMGYCPQFDAVIDSLTGRETLTMYARMRGVPEASIDKVVKTLINILMLDDHADKRVGQYSGGNKRKLSTAMALVGDPPFIMLDEPSSGMDPKARRQLWNVLSQVRASGRTLVLTSHSMEECDALCTRLAIMVNGRFVCLGSPQHLKSKFGQGYTLIVKMAVMPDGTMALKVPVIQYISQNFPGAQVFDDHQGYVHFQVPSAGVKLAQVFSHMEQTKAYLHVEEYSVQQTTLEQIFLAFTRAQVPPKESKQRSCMTKTFCWPCIKMQLL